MRTYSLNGRWMVSIKTQNNPSPDCAYAPAVPVMLPGTLDENHIGYPDENNRQWHPDINAQEGEGNEEDGRILTRLTRNYTYAGPAVYSTCFHLSAAPGERVFLDIERSRRLSVSINDKPAVCKVPGTLSTPAVYELTGLLDAGDNTLKVCCDNTYPSWPEEPILYSSAATDETQTNWNGLLGTLRLRVEEANFIAGLRVYPTEGSVKVEVDLDCAHAQTGTLTLSSEALENTVIRTVCLKRGLNELAISDIPLSARALPWDEEEGRLYTLTAWLAEGDEGLTVRFGIRTFGSKEGRLALNHRKIFLRSEANCCVFPETGHTPMTVPEWLKVLKTYHSYGINCMRFHSHCPPEAAFAAADELGMLMQPELSHWDPRQAFETQESYAYYQLELKQILRTYANHPSFVMLSLGNELHPGLLGYKRMQVLLHTARSLDPTRLYANASNAFYGSLGADPDSDFFTGDKVYDIMFRATSSNMHGHLNEQAPNARTNYDEAMARLREEYDAPAFGFEVGQYEILPDFDELKDFQGVTRPDNLAAVRDQVIRRGWMDTKPSSLRDTQPSTVEESDVCLWKQMVEATGELSLLSYREEIEAVRRTDGMSGISLLGLQDFPGQGTSLVGMLNSHLKPKPYSFAAPERFRAFFGAQALLIGLERYTYRWGDTLAAPVWLSNYGKKELNGSLSLRLAYTDPAATKGEDTLYEGKVEGRSAPIETLSRLAEISITLLSCQELMNRPLYCTLTASLLSEPEITTTYPIWIYPAAEPVSESSQADTGDLLVTTCVCEALSALREGKKVFLSPPADEAHFPRSIAAQFSTDFWSVKTFDGQSGFMGLLLDPQHPAFRGFPTQAHTNWQWWPMCRGRAMLLSEHCEPLIRGLDSYATLRPLGLLLEAQVEQGSLLLDSMGLLQLEGCPEAEALLKSLLNYMRGDCFAPRTRLTQEELNSLVTD